MVDSLLVNRGRDIRSKAVANDSSHVPVVRALFAALALSSRINEVKLMQIDEGGVPGIDSLVSQAQTCRRVKMIGDIAPASTRTLATRCDTRVVLDAVVSRWANRGSSLAEAMIANWCPAKLDLDLRGLDGASILFLARAFEITTRIERLTIRMQQPGVHVEVWQAISRNGSIREHVAHHSPPPGL